MKIRYILLLIIPLLLFAQLWQSYRYQVLLTEVERLEEEQETWYERNKAGWAAAAAISSPERISTLAEEELGLEKLKDGRLIRVLSAPRGDGE